MTGRPRRNHTPAFKAKVALAASKARRRCSNWLSNSTFIPTRSHSGRRSFSIRPPGFLDRTASPGTVVDMTVLYAKIGELTLENDSLAGVLGKAGLLSAKR